MANYQLLKADIDAKVYQNGRQEITGANLNAVLNAMVTTLGAEYQFAGVATIGTNPGSPDAKVFYIANGKGTYTNFGGIEVTEDEVVVLYYDTEWHKVATGIASNEKLTELGQDVTDLTERENYLDNVVFGNKEIVGDSLIKINETSKAKMDFSISGNSGATRVISCGVNLANLGNVQIGKNWTGSANANRSILKVKAKGDADFCIKVSGINPMNISVFETDSFNATSASTSHAIIVDTETTFHTYGFTEWLVILFNKDTPMSAQDLSGLIVYCNEGTQIKEVANISDIVEVSGNTIGKLDTFEYTTYVYTENDDATLSLSVPTFPVPYPVLIVCGYDAPEQYKSIAKKAVKSGTGYVCTDDEFDTGINAFLDGFMDSRVDVHFYGTIRTKGGIHKHPKHNLYGDNCTLKMGDGIGSEYVSCIFPTSGGKTFEQSQVISHNYTIIRGFTLDGNCENNKSGGNYVFDPVYGGVIMPEIYNEKVSPYSRTQSIKDLILENITAVNTMRGIIVGTNWICRNLVIGDSATDHALYIAGGDNAIVENVYIYGTHNRGAIAISPQSWVVSRRVRNVHLRNIKLDECQAINGPLLDIRGHFSDWGNNKGLDNVFIDGLYIQNITTTIPVRAIVVGTQSANMVGAGYMSYTMNVVMRDVFIDAKVRNSLFVINNASFVSQNMYIIFRDYKPERPLFNIQGNSNIVKSIDLSSLRLYFYMESEYETPYVLFGIDNSDSNYRLVDGFNIDNACLYGIRNFYLFGRAGEDKNVVSVTDVSAEKLCIYPLATIKPGDENYISISPKQYYSL